MDLKEVENYTVCGRVCVDIQLVPEYSGFVRQVIFYVKNRVCVEFIGHGILHESGYEFCHVFSTLIEAIESIEDYLAKPIGDWINHTKTGIYPDLPPNTDIKLGASKLLIDTLDGKVKLPRKGPFKMDRTSMRYLKEIRHSYLESLRQKDDE